MTRCIFLFLIDILFSCMSETIEDHGDLALRAKIFTIRPDGVNARAAIRKFV